MKPMLRLSEHSSLELVLDDYCEPGDYFGRPVLEVFDAETGELLLSAEVYSLHGHDRYLTSRQRNVFRLEK